MGPLENSMAGFNGPLLSKPWVHPRTHLHQTTHHMAHQSSQISKFPNLLEDTA